MTLPNDVNEQVAKAAGLVWDLYPLDIKKITVDEWVNGVDPFEPDKDDAAAIFALKAWAQLNNVSVSWSFYPAEKNSHSCTIGSTSPTEDLTTTCDARTLCHAVCEAILAAEEGRTK